MVQYYKIAGLTVKMDTFGQAENQAIPYRIAGCDAPDMEIQSEREEIAAKMPQCGEVTCEYLGTGWSFYRQLVRFNGLMLHASAVVMDGKAYLFAATSGTGKSTHTSNWRCVFGDERVRILNDDKPALRRIDGVWYAYGTPWCGKTGQNLNLRFPIAGIAKVERGAENRIARLPEKEAVSLVLRQTCVPREPEGKLKLLELLDQLVTEVPFWRLECTREPESAYVSYEAMSQA